MSTTGRSPTVFFCVGSEKSGTTLLARMLDQHPDIACLWESYAFRPDSRASIFNPASEKWRRHGFSESDVRRWSRIWNAQPQAFFRRNLGRLTGRNFFIDSCFRRTMPSALADFADRCNARVAGDKWPGHIGYLENLLAVFPDARFIYSVRDPRGLWNSAQRFKDRHRGDELLNRMLENDERIGPYLERPSFLTLRYEDLVCRPEDTMERLHGFLGCDRSIRYLPYDPRDDRYPDRWSWVPEASGPIDSSHAFKWKAQLGSSDLERITGMAGGFIDRHGYDR
ncbi:MAG: sulfotransferase [Planctomycetaceae bacterium]|nr:sulfotransferase [Planctomycetaceae bacterium]